jgi:hypothetical protein
MGFATVFASIAFLFIFVSMAFYAAHIQKNLTEAATVQREADEIRLKNDRSSINIVSTSYTLYDIVDWTENLYTDFSGGTASNAEVLGEGTVQLTGAPYVNGTFTSQIINTGYTSNFTTLSWTSVSPVNTAISFQLRAENSSAALVAGTFTGPDGTSGTYYTVSGAAINSMISNNTYIQYKAFLNTSDDTKTPELHSVTIGIQRAVGVTTIVVENNGAEHLVPEQTDIYIGTDRLLRNTTKRVMTLDDVANQALWDPSETITFTAFKTLSTGQIVTVANNAATDSSTVSP